MRKLFTFVLLLILASCLSGIFRRHKKGMCFKEIDKRYLAPRKLTIYRIDRVKYGLGYWISQYNKQKRTWQELGRKGFSYFDETELFTYKMIKCPLSRDEKEHEDLNLDALGKHFKKETNDN